jgi:HD-GYP domain-containing protein (c-di-GMP phosphodiesterase class II)
MPHLIFAPVAQPEPPEPDRATIEAQLAVFAREVGSLWTAERKRSRELHRAVTSLEETYVATMQSLAQVVEEKDRTTAGHLGRTQRYGLALAARVDPTLAERPDVAYGFYLHDIGKVGVPEQVLGKPGPLDEGEWRLMREHPAIGARIIEPIRFLTGAMEIVRSHHERWDGGGYPDRLAGDAIPLTARIFALADSFDAMTSDRPYRRAMPVEAAFEEIRKGAGTQFDPRIASEFLALAEGGELVTVSPDPLLPRPLAEAS